MSDKNYPSRAAPAQHLAQLTLIRSILLGCLWLSFALSSWFDIAFMAHSAVFGLLIIFSAIHGLTFIRLRNKLVVTEWEFFIQLLIDVICLNALFYFSGGANNPFISYLLVPICISAATLPWRFTWSITGLCLSAYTLLLFFHVDLSIFQVHQDNSTLSWHILGMWLNFFISAILITYFVVKMADALRKQNELVVSLREDELRNEQLVAVATHAAGAAHEINTPLSTMVVLLSELKNDFKHDSNLLSDLELLERQVKHCATVLKQLVNDSSAAVNGNFKECSINNFCNFIIDRWQLMRPAIKFHLTISQNLDDKFHIKLDPRIEQAIINLLNNAADASPENIDINVDCDNNFLVWQIFDQGSGISKDLVLHLGKSLISTKENGLGLGMLLSHASIKYHGGMVTQRANTPTGTITELRLPLSV